MPSWRWSGGTNRPLAASLTTRPAMAMVPVSLRSRPATMRKVVVLPQPDGPSSVTNSPCSTERSMASTALISAKCRPTACRVTLGTAVRLLVDLLGEFEHGVLSLRHRGAERLGREQGPDLFQRLLDHALDDRIVAGVGIDDLRLGLEVVVHEQARGVGTRRPLQHREVEADPGAALDGHDRLHRQALQRVVVLQRERDVERELAACHAPLAVLDVAREDRLLRRELVMDVAQEAAGRLLDAHPLAHLAGAG